LTVGEVCLVIPDNSIYWKKDAGTIVGPYLVASSPQWGNIGGTLSTQTDLQAALNAKANATNAALSGIPTAPTAATSTNTTQIATTEFVQAVVAALVNAAPGTLDTLNELAAALGNDPNFASTLTTTLAGKIGVNDTIDGGTIA
jgi:hypothetical protein